MRKRKEPLLDEVRKWKDEVYKEAGGTLEGLFRLLEEEQKKYPPHLLVDRSTKGKRPKPSDDPES
ncbi:MAG: hypothetical protein QOH21_1030 [Acidobacteriota bacterium]|jgi:hypothetical protein|nr:hypothetical protein [Acidobacteriota bacterium]